MSLLTNIVKSCKNSNMYNIMYNMMNNKKVPLLIDNFKEIITISDDDWNNVKNGEKNIKYYNNEGKYIGYINYRLAVGQIGLFYLDKNYRNRGLGKQILNKTINDIKDYGTKEVWVVSSENDQFWSNVNNKSFINRDPAHSSIRSSGFFMKIK